MPNLKTPINANYAAQIVRVKTIIDKLPGLDNLVGVPVFNYQALTQRDGVAVGDLKVAFTAETQLSEQYAFENNLHRHAELNVDITQTGYLEDNRRIRAMRMRGNESNALLMPLSSLSGFQTDKFNITDLKEGDTFDHLDGQEVCRKYVIATKGNNNPAKTKVEKAFKRVDKAQFPEHLETDNYWRNSHLHDDLVETVVTQKLHGTSFRVGHVPVLRELSWKERLAKRIGVRVDTHEYDVVYGSRKVIKDVNNPRQQHFYAEDIWTAYGKTIAELIPEGYLVYGELVGWTPDGTPLQKGYTYGVPKGHAELYVYRVATINRHGVMSDLSWDGVKAFCRARGLAWTPELVRGPGGEMGEWLEAAKDAVFWEDYKVHGAEFTDEPLVLSNAKTVDEGVCLRQEGQTPTILKAKSSVFLEHETKLLDKGEEDIESQEALAA